jgi:cystathionine gamma-synthase
MERAAGGLAFVARDKIGSGEHAGSGRPMKHPETLQPASWIVAAGRAGDAGEALNTPLVPASNFLRGTGAERVYAREHATPTWEALEEVVGGLEGGRAVAFASGMAAVAAVFDQLAAGTLVAIPDDCYHGVVTLALEGEAKGRWRVQRVGLTDTEAWVRACGSADLVWIESPSNPLLTVTDLASVCAAPRRPGTILAIDNTFATPLNQQPLVLGADVSVHSATKLIGGHSDLLSGVAVTAGDDLYAALRRSRSLNGATPGALEAYLAVRGARTLAVRLERAQQNAQRLAERLVGHPQVEVTRYPGLADHPAHTIASKQMRGFGTVVTFDVRGGAAAADAVCARVELIRHATSLGGVESTIERRAGVPGQEHLPPGMLRLSVGIEDAEDLWADLDAALRSTGATGGAPEAVSRGEQAGIH